MKTVLITGALGGLGKAFAKHFAAIGHNLVITDIRSCDALAAELGETGVDVWTDTCELGDSGDIARFVAAVARAGRTVDIPVNNAADQRLAHRQHGVRIAMESTSRLHLLLRQQDGVDRTYTKARRS